MTQNKSNKRYLLSRSIPMYFLLIPGFLLILVFHYAPMFGLMIAFKDFDLFGGSSPVMAMLESKWIGLSNFADLFGLSQFRDALRNTFAISFLKLFIGFPVPIILALLVNEINGKLIKRVVQTTLYLPHFMSWVIIAALFKSIFGTGGVVNALIVSLGGKVQRFFMDNFWFRWLLLVTDIWKESGWGTIVYLAAITGIDPQLYEAAKIDRANRLQQIWHVTLPGIASTVVMMLILRLGGLMDAGFGQVLAMYNPTVYQTGDIIGTYIYRTGLGQLNFSRGTTVGLFNSLVSFVLVMSGNVFSRKLSGKSIW